MEAVLVSTSAAAALLGIEALVGTVARGKEADLLVIEGNPLRKIELLRDRSRIVGVMKAGRFVAGPLSQSH
jgi:imidazolonepropionase-like amidohydrolase